MELFKKNQSKYYWYDFTVRGERYRGSTKETNETRAQKTAALKLAATIKGVRSAMVYQHPEGEIIRNALNARHIARPTVPDNNQANA